MLSTDSTSSIQRRRQQHRRQQSLEVPILATPLPADNRRSRPAAHSHRRGLSLDQNLTVPSAPFDFHSQFRQDRGLDHFQGPSPVRIRLDTTNLGHQTNQQHFVQETQQHTPSQPGYLAQNFQSHLQQQLIGNFHPTIISPTPTHPIQHQVLQGFRSHSQQQLHGNVMSTAAPTHDLSVQRQAAQELEKHLQWYHQNFGHSPKPDMSTNTSVSQDQIIVNEPTQTHMDFRPASIGPQTPDLQNHARTVPNTPQHHAQSWPSPPASNVKHVRSQSFQFDVAPMPTSFDVGHLNSSSQSLYSVGSSSAIDASSPGPQYRTSALPTLFEDHSTSFDFDGSNTGLTDDALLLQAAAGASDDFNSPNFMVGGGSMVMSPNTAILNSLGPEVNCSIVDTGVPPEKVEACISQPDINVSKFYCLYDEGNGQPCGKDFQRRENCRSHVQNHLDDRQFYCNDCGKTFVRQHDMKRHSAIHTDERPHICPCGNKFARHDALTRHRQRGMCEGALPGFEKTEEEKPKRGRPKKERPDRETRTLKANKARAMDRKDSVRINYASSSSGLSEHSLPMTPPNDTDFSTDAFFNNLEFTNDSSSWRDTPPTSPFTSPTKCISPSVLTNNASSYANSTFYGGSSPLNDYTELNSSSNNYGLIDTQPDVAVQELFSDNNFMSPYGHSDASSPFTAADELAMCNNDDGQKQFSPLSGEFSTQLSSMLEQFCAGDGTL